MPWYGWSRVTMSCSQDVFDHEPSAKRRKLSAITSSNGNSISTDHNQAYHQHSGCELQNGDGTDKLVVESSDSGMTDGLDSTSCPSTAPNISGPPENGPLTVAKRHCAENVACREVCYGMVSLCKAIQVRWNLMRLRLDHRCQFRAFRTINDTQGP